MEKSVSRTVGNNLLKLRKDRGLTQLELAKQLNFSDKTISKWESGESLPSIDVLKELTDFYNISMSDLVSPDFEIQKPGKKQLSTVQTKQIIIACLFITILWLVIAVIFVYAKLYAKVSLWILFVWGIPLSLIFAIVFNKFWGNSKTSIYLISAFIWTFLMSFYLQFMNYSLWVIFILGIPIQVLIVLWFGLRKQIAKQKKHQK